jgi:uncharacterized protein YggT (Ycf19 family)
MEEEQRTEVHETNTQVDGATARQQTVSRTTTKVSGVVMGQRIVWFIVGVINILLAIRFVLLLLGANHDAGFVDFIYSVTNFFVAPFTGIFGTPTYGVSVFDISSLLAIVIYSLIAYGITKLITLSRPREEV